MKRFCQKRFREVSKRNLNNKKPLSPKYCLEANCHNYGHNFTHISSGTQQEWRQIKTLYYIKNFLQPPSNNGAKWLTSLHSQESKSIPYTFVIQIILRFIPSYNTAFSTPNADVFTFPSFDIKSILLCYNNKYQFVDFLL